MPRRSRRSRRRSAMVSRVPIRREGVSRMAAGVVVGEGGGAGGEGGGTAGERGFGEADTVFQAGEGGGGGVEGDTGPGAVGGEGTAGADAELEAAVGEDVEGGRFLGDEG